MNIVEASNFAGAVSGFVLFLMAALGIRAFAPRIRNAEEQSSRLLALAIVMAFSTSALNALYWQVWGFLALHYDLVSVTSLRLLGGFLDVFFKGCAALAVYLHLAAWRASLPPEERGLWSVLGMAFYPKRTGFLARALNGLRANRED